MMLATAKPTLTDGFGPGPARENKARPAGLTPGQTVGVPKAPKLRIKFNGQVVVNKTITETDKGAPGGQKRKLEAVDPVTQKAPAKKALSSGMDGLVRSAMLIPGDLYSILEGPHGKLTLSKPTLPAARRPASITAGGPCMTEPAMQSNQLPREVQLVHAEQPIPSPAGPPAKKQRLQEPTAAQQIVPPAAVSAPAPQASNAQQEPAPVLAMGWASAPAQAAARQLQQQADQPTHSSAAAAQQQQTQPSNASITGCSPAEKLAPAQAAQTAQQLQQQAAQHGHGSSAAAQQQQAQPSKPVLANSSTTEKPALTQAAQQAHVAAPKVSLANPSAHHLPGRDLPVVERARAELRAAVAERERQKAAQQEAARAQASSQASQQQTQGASSGPQNQKALPAQGTAGAHTTQVPNEEKARWLAKIRARRPTQEQKEAEEKQRIAEAAKREQERKQQEAEEKARKEAVERIEKLEETLQKYCTTGVPEWLQKGTLFEEEEREEWVGVYKLAGRPWPAKYDISGACCLPEGADAAAAQPEGADAAAARPGPPGAPRHKTKSRLARSDSDMDIDDPVLPDLPKRSLLAALESTAAVARAAASGQSCGTHNGASPDIVNTSMAPPAQLHSSAAAGPQAEACLSAAAATLKANHAVKESRPSPGSSESETEGVNIPAPKLEEGELAGNRRSAPHKGQSPREDVAWDQRGSHERRSRDIYSRNRDSSERASREHTPTRHRHHWRERSRSRSRDYDRMHRARPSSPESRSRERASSERYPRAHASHQRPSHKPDSRKCRYSERYSRERSPSRARRDWRDRSRSPCRDDERACCACVGSPVHEDPAELRAKMEALKASTQHEKRYMEVALAALQRRLVKALMAEHLQKKQSREADRARSRPAAASMEAADKVAQKQSAAVVKADMPTATHTTAPPLPEGLPPPKLAPLPPVPVMPAVPTCPQPLWPVQAAAHAPNGLPACYPAMQHSAAVGVYPAQYGQPWPQQGWVTAPGVQYAPGVPKYWA